MSSAYSYDRLDMGYDEAFDPQRLYDDAAAGAASPVAAPPRCLVENESSIAAPVARYLVEGSEKLYIEESSPPLSHSESGKFSDQEKEFMTPITPNRAKTFAEPQLSYDHEGQDIQQWSPALLGILPMSFFALFLLLLIIGLEMLNRRSPYSAPSSGMLFFWTYFPVAVLMLVEWIWVAYDLQVKVLVPWASMSHEFTPARKGWLLDYVGANYFLSIWTAIKYRHFVILLATLGLWSTAVAGIVTTSLFQVQDVSHTSPRALTRTTMMDSSSFTVDALADKGYLNSYLGRQVLTLSRPRWTTPDDIVMEAVKDSSAASAPEVLTLTTRGYSAELNCTAATISYAGNITVPSTDWESPNATVDAYLVNVAGAECQVTYTLTDQNIGPIIQDVTYYYGRVYNHTCPGSSRSTTILAMATMRNFGFISATAVECSSNYQQHSLAATVPASSTSHVAASTIPDSSEPFAAPPAWEWMLMWINSTNGGVRETNPHTYGFEDDPWGTWRNTAIEESETCDCDPWFYLVSHAQNVTQMQLMDGQTLMNTTQLTFAGVWSDLAQALLMVDASSSPASVPGQVTILASQLVARPTSVRVSQAALAVLIAVTLAVYALRPRTSLPMDPASIATQAFLLQHDHEEISAIIKDTATMSQPATQAVLHDCEFKVQNQPHFVVATRRTGPIPEVPSSRDPAPAWRPIILHPLFKAVLALTLIGTIVALELTLRRSRVNDGFADLRSAEQTSWTYFAPAYLFLLGVLVSSYTFSVSTLEPFFAMSHSPQPARKSVRYSPAHRTSIGLIFHALRYHSHVGLSCAAIMLIVPFLKITVSGLITTATSPVHNGVQVALQTIFNTTTIFPLNDSAAGAPAIQERPMHTLALSQIEKYGLSLPMWTTPVGAVGHVELDQLGQLFATQNSTVTIPLPVMRGDLENCSTLTGSNLTILPSNAVQLPLPPTSMRSDGVGDTFSACVFNDQYDTNYGRPENVSFTLPTSPGWFGKLYHQTCGGYVMIYGNTKATNASVIDNISVVHCTSYSLTMSIQNVTLVDAAPNVNILTIDPSSQNTIPMTSFPYNESGYLIDNSVNYYEVNSSHSFDSFTQILTLKNTSTPLEAFLDPATLTSAVQALYTTYWSIFATLNLVIPVNSTTGSVPVRAVTNSSRTRIIQAEIPTRILQALLACVLAFGLLTALSVRKTHGVLTKPPYSIGATMGLLADSAFVEIEGLRDVRKEEDLDVLLEPYLFGLGWGSNTKGGNRFGIDVVPG
ncbi:hypothetical protein B0H19DRAFT_1381528 [Mycena capillaripes]|nr:hypothetical protein B0H19DRAFT_1381528 [Mycena capillaripes]